MERHLRISTLTPGTPAAPGLTPLPALGCPPRSQQPPADLTAPASYRCGVPPSQASLHSSHADPSALVSSFCLLHYPRLHYSLLHGDTHTQTLTFPSPIFLSLKLDNLNVFMLITSE